MCVCFSIRSFGSFDGTLESEWTPGEPNCFSIRSFGSFDGTLREGSETASRTKFQYPLFRII